MHIAQPAHFFCLHPFVTVSAAHLGLHLNTGDGGGGAASLHPASPSFWRQSFSPHRRTGGSTLVLTRHMLQPSYQPRHVAGTQLPQASRDGRKPLPHGCMHLPRAVVPMS